MSEEKIPSPEVAADDKLAQTRALELPLAESIPAPAIGYKPSTASEKSYLRRISDKLQAEAVLALDECTTKGSQLAADLGKYVPAPDTLVKLLIQKKQTVALKARLAALDQFIQEKDDVLNNDIAIALDKIGRELEHNLENDAQLASQYANTLTFTRAHGESVREGRERAKQKKEEAK